MCLLCFFTVTDSVSVNERGEEEEQNTRRKEKGERGGIKRGTEEKKRKGVWGLD